MAQDLLFQQEVKQAVRSAYETITTGGGEVGTGKLGPVGLVARFAQLAYR